MMSLGLNIILFGARQQLILQKEKAVASGEDDNRSFHSCFFQENSTGCKYFIFIHISLFH